MQPTLCSRFVGPAQLQRLLPRLCSWVLVPWEFFRFNLLAGASAQYGGHPWHWNLTQGLPAVVASLVPLLATGLLQAGPERR